MYLIPFFIEEPKITSLGCKMWTVWVFTSKGGKEIWQTEKRKVDTIVQEEFLNNNLYGSVIPTIQKDVLLYKIDTEATNISEFYTWKDMLQGTSCHEEIWRPFFWVGTSRYGETDEWGWEDEAKEIRLGPFGTVDTLWKVLRDGVKDI